MRTKGASQSAGGRDAQHADELAAVHHQRGTHDGDGRVLRCEVRVDGDGRPIGRTGELRVHVVLEGDRDNVEDLGGIAGEDGGYLRQGSAPCGG